MIDLKNNLDIACFEVNQHGRIISGNRRFCRMFGYSEAEIVWHYITDFYRHREEWELFRNCDDMTQHHFVARMRNRKGRSFKCEITREILQDAEGHVTFRSYVSRMGETKVPEIHEESTRTVVFMTKCAQCNCQMRVNSLAETRMRVLCDGCAAKAYPEAFNLKAAANV